MKRSNIVALTATLWFGASTALAALPAMQHQGEVQFVTGGVGEDEAESMRAAQAKFPLALEFVRRATPRDEYLADVEVSVLDRRGRSVLDAQADGPFLLAKLPAGDYTVKATYAGHTLDRKVHVTDHASARAVFVWAG
ncbi:MAG TPA: carboxypeptidase regulatory-like domain-containing protein [Burkholderiales bacterium]|nr:carboxypeptidase regulatory-like domain-containing protein [Burkholderiales bacterium]